MKERKRVEKDIALFEEHVASVEGEGIVEMATRYCDDAKYYLEEQDLFTAFGCINYAHGLLDAVRTKAFKDESAL